MPRAGKHTIESFLKLPLRREDTWQGRSQKLPGWINEPGGDPYRAVMAVWASGLTGAIGAGNAMKPPLDMNTVLDALFKFAFDRKIAGYRPARLAVADAEMADFLRTKLGRVVEIVVERHLPEIDAAMKDMRDHLCGGEAPPGPLDGKGVTVERMRAFAGAAMVFYRAAPWEHASGEELVVIESRVPEPALSCFSILGSAGETTGLGFWSSRAEFENLATARKPNAAMTNNDRWLISFDRRDGRPIEDDDLWEDHDLPVAGPDAYPVAALLGPGGLRRPGARQLAFFEGLLTALAVTTPKRFATGRWTEIIATTEGPMEFCLAIPSRLKLVSVSRNAPCPCGSGKKYKLCCIDETPAAPTWKPLRLEPRESRLERIRRDRNEVISRLLAFVKKRFGADLMERASEDFWGGKSPLPDDWDDGPLTIPYALFHFFEDDEFPGPRRGRREEDDLERPETAGTAAMVFLNEERHRLTEFQQMYISKAVLTPFSFHEVLECTPGSGMRLRDILTGVEHDVVEREGSRSVQAGDVYFAQVVKFDRLALFEGASPFIIPPIHRIEVVRLRAGIEKDLKRPIGIQDVMDYRYDILTLLTEIAYRIFHPPMPVLANTDGDPILLHRLIYDIDDPRAVFDRLVPLAKGEDPLDLLEQATRSANGDLLRIEFPWLKAGNAKSKAMDTTLLGSITIEGTTLTIAVNSAKRANRIRRSVTRLAGPLARYRTTVIESIDAKLKAGDEPEPLPGSDDLEKRPEIRAALREFQRKHLRGWIDEPVPALGNVTPRQAVKTRDGVEMVDALLKQFEQSERRRFPDEPDAEIFREVRGILGLSQA